MKIVVRKLTMRSFVLQMLKKQSMTSMTECRIFLFRKKGKFFQKLQKNHHLNANNRANICKIACQDSLQLLKILHQYNQVTLIMIALSMLHLLNMPHRHFFKDRHRHLNLKENRLFAVASVSPNYMKVPAVIFKTISTY